VITCYSTCNLPKSGLWYRTLMTQKRSGISRNLVAEYKLRSKGPNPTFIPANQIPDYEDLEFVARAKSK